MHVEANGIRFWVEREGSGPPVLLLHGFPETHRSWDLQTAFLVEKGYTVFRPDLRGYGKSDHPQTGYDLPTLAADVAGLIEALGVGSVRLVGHDWGGAITWEVATRYPELLSHVAVLDCPHPLLFYRALRTNRRQMRRSWYMFFFQLPRLPELWLQKNDGENIARMFRTDAPDRERTEAAESLSVRGALRGPLAMYRTAGKRSLTQPPTPNDYPAIRLPFSLIWGEADSCLGTELMDGSEQFAPEIQFHVVPDAGHFVHQESPDAVNAILLRALA